MSASIGAVLARRPIAWAKARICTRLATVTGRDCGERRSHHGFEAQ